MAEEMISERCAEHKVTEADILGRLKVLEDDVRQLFDQLEGKANVSAVRDIAERSCKEIDELKRAILRLDAADGKHSEALAGIHQILKAFKETQDLMRQDYSKLAECYTQSSVHIASITTILAERARKEEEKLQVPKIEVSTSNDPWYVRLVNKSNALTATLVGVVIIVMGLLIANFDKVIQLLQNIFGK